MRAVRRKFFAAAVVLALGALPAIQAGAAEPRASANLQLVAGIPGAGGTDIEFFSRTLSSYLDSTGTTITPPAPVERHFAFVGNQTSGAKIVDITEPEKPFIASAVKGCTVGQGDPQIRNDGMIAALAFQTNGSCNTADGVTVPKGSAMIDLADVYNPLVVGAAPDTEGLHDQSIYPSGNYLYISTSTRATAVPVYDLSDPTARVKEKSFTDGGAPHDIRFSRDGKRAYFAGPGQSFTIVNTENPANPVEVAQITAPSTIGHDTLITPDGRFLF